MKLASLAACGAAACLFAPAAYGAEPVTNSPTAAPAAQPAPTPPSPAAAQEAVKPCCLIPAGTMVTVAIAEPLSAKRSVAGDSFKLKLTAPIVINGVTVVPAGLMGVGEVIDARPGAMGGSPGKLILAARYLDDNGVRVPLQSLKLGGSGADNTGSAVMASALVSPLLILAVKGGDLAYPEGTPASAKVAADVQITPPPAAQTAPAAGSPGAPPPPAAPAPTTDNPTASKGSTP